MPLNYYSYDICFLSALVLTEEKQHPRLILSLPELTFSVHIFNGAKLLHAPLLPH